MIRRASRVLDLTAQLLPGALLIAAGTAIVTAASVGALWH